MQVGSFFGYVGDKSADLTRASAVSHIDEKVARLHLDKIGAKLTTMSKNQADYIGVPEQGPYKTDAYRY